MEATKQLSEEHKAVKLMLEILEEIAERLKSKEKVNPEHLDQLVEFMKVFVDGCHHAKEEDVLFPALEKAGIPKEGGPIGVMLEEHDEERVFVKDLVQGINEYKQGEEKAAKKIIYGIENIDSLLAPHIDKEDNVLYMMADMHLSEKEQDKLFEEFEKIENEKVGAGKHEQFHKMLDELEKIYLN
jgi:hemerythrin-like domain-containing protein